MILMTILCWWLCESKMMTFLLMLSPTWTRGMYHPYKCIRLSLVRLPAIGEIQWYWILRAADPASWTWKLVFPHNFAKHGIAKLLIIYLTTRDHPRSKSHGPGPASHCRGSQWNLKYHWISPTSPYKMIKLVKCQSSFSHDQCRSSFLFNGKGNRYWYRESHSNIFEKHFLTLSNPVKSAGI